VERLPKAEYREQRRAQAKAERETVMAAAICRRCGTPLAGPGTCAKCLRIGGFPSTTPGTRHKRRRMGISRSRQGR
jgi:rubrerythrin